MSAGPRVLVAGDLNPDIVVRSAEPPRFGQAEQVVDGIDVTLGGSAGIVACGIARLGLDATLVAAIGGDDWGRWCTAALTARGVGATGLRIVAAPTGATVLLLREGGADRAILTSPGAIAQLAAADVTNPMLAAHQHLHVCSVFLVDALRPGLLDLCARARAAGLTVTLDPNFDPSGRWEIDDAVLAAVDVLLVNATEAAALAGAAPGDAPATAKAARLLAERCPAVVVKDGVRGALLACGSELTWLGPPPVTAVDATGAGDSLSAGVIYGLTAGWPLADAVALGVACGSASVRAAGGTSAQPTLAQAEVLLAAVSRRRSG